MTDPKRSAGRWSWIAASLGAIAVAVWLLMSAPRESPMRPKAPAAPEVPAPPPAAEAAPSAPELPSLRIAEGGRLSIAAEELPEDAPLSLVLEISDEARGEGVRSVRVVSVDGRRLDASATPLAGEGSGVRLDVEPGFLSPGRYLIEIDTVDPHPLRIRRFVLEVK